MKRIFHNPVTSSFVVAGTHALVWKFRNVFTAATPPLCRPMRSFKINSEALRRKFATPGGLVFRTRSLQPAPRTEDVGGLPPANTFNNRRPPAEFWWERRVTHLCPELSTRSYIQMPSVSAFRLYWREVSAALRLPFYAHLQKINALCALRRRHYARADFTTL